MIQKKNLINSIKRALQTGTFNYIGQQIHSFPKQLFNIDTINFDDQNWWQCLPITKIDVSNNQIQQIPDELLNLPDIQLIRMKNNKLNSLNKNILKLQFIKSIDLFKNRITQLPEEIKFNKTLVEINIAENFIEYCPSLADIHTLQHVFFNDNKLKQLPNFGKGLKKLQASNNKIRLIRKDNFIQCNQLECINLNKNQIQFIEVNSFSRLSNLILLQLKQNKLSVFQQIPRSQKLDTINLAYNNLKQYSIFSSCPNLTVLILSNNKLTKISRQIIQLQKLKTLDLQNNDLPQMPCEIGFINSLVRLQIQGNPLKSIRQNIRNGGTNVLKKYLKDRMPPEQKQLLESKQSTTFEQKSTEKQYWTKLINQFNQSNQLILRNMQLISIDSMVYEKNLKGLNLSDNQIKQLSEQIGKLKSLKYIIMNKNILQTLPVSLGTIQTLESIQCKNNKICSFGSIKNNSLNKYKSLKHLDLSANKFTQIPLQILLLPNLRTLYFSYNQISSISQIFSSSSYLPLLQTLDISNNLLQQIPQSIINKPTLNYFNIQNNNLKNLPTVLGFMKLSALKVDGNPLKLIKRTVIQKGTIALLEFLKTKHQGPIPQIKEKQKIQEKIEVEEEQQWPYQGKGKNNIQGNNMNRMNNNNNNNNNNFNNNFNNNINNYNNKKMQVQYIPQQIKTQQKINQQTLKRIKQIQKQVQSIQYQLDNNYSLNSVIKNNKKKYMQQLIIEKNKLLK